MNSINVFRLFKLNCLGFFKYSLSTLSNGRVNCPKSYSKPSTNNWIGVSGKNGNRTLAIITDITSPKLKLVAIFIYFIRLPNVFLPSVTPSNNTCKSFSSRIVSADSLAISTAVSTEIPTSEFVSEGASLIPSPIYPTTFPESFNSLTIRAFWIGDSLTNIFVFFKSLITPLSSSCSIWFPSIISSELIPTFLQMHFVTSKLSPVKTITLIPDLLSFSIAVFADSFGGSRNPINPSRTMSFSSFKSNIFVSRKLFFWQTAITLSPSLFKFLEICFIFSFILFVIGETWPL